MPTASASVAVETDNLVALDWTKADGVCDNKICVAYYKDCKKKDGNRVCTYHLSTDQWSYERVISIVAASDDDLKTAEASIGVLDSRTGFDSEVVLGKLATVSLLGSPPRCSLSDSRRHCWPGH
jgi:hypothetical protein